MKAFMLGRCPWWAVFCLGLALCGQAWGITITRYSGATIFTDGGSQILQCSYAAYAISNNSAINFSNVWVKFDTFSGTIVRLGGGDPGIYPLDDLAANQMKMAYVYLQATNTTGTAQTHSVHVYNGYPGLGTELTNISFSLTAASPGANNSSKVDSVTYSPTLPTLGGYVNVTVNGDCGQVQANDNIDFTPAAFTNWTAGAFQLVNVSISFTNKNNAVTNLSNYLELPTWVPNWGNGQLLYQAKYIFHCIAVTTSNTPVSPITLATQGNTETHTPTSGYGNFAPIQVPTNTTLLSLLASVTQLYTNETLTYTVRITNSGTNEVVLDRIVDTLPPGFIYVPGSSTFNSLSVIDPVITTNSNVRTLTYSEFYTNPATSSRDLSFQAIAITNGFATNTVIAFANTSQIDTTYPTSDNVPASNTVRVVITPSAVNDTGTAFEDTTLNVSAPGVLGNDSDPNGFSITVVSYTQPSHGSVTVNANGSYSYLAATNYNGSDSFTYTLTNGNARTSTATVNLTVTAVNDPPTLSTINNVSVGENAGAQTVNLSGITAGPSDESQTLTITATSSNPSLIPNPTVTYTSPNTTGSLSFTSTTCGLGSSTISVVVQDNGGTVNSGIDAVTNTFTITVTGVTNVWGTGGSATATVTNANGIGGAGISLSNITASLAVQATSGSPFTINLVSINGTTPGQAANFSYGNGYTWTIATAPCGVTGFAANKFVVNNSQFSNDLAGGTFSVGLSGDSKSIQVIFTPNNAPVANAATFGRAWGTASRIALTNLLASFTTDADGDSRAVTLVGTSTNGSFVSTNSAYILLAPTNNLPESFRYTVRDLRTAYRAGDTVLTATNWLTVTITNAFSSAQSVTNTGNGIAITFAGVPGYSYVVQRASSVGGPYTTLDGSGGTTDSRTNAPSTGLWLFTETPPFSPAFYRTRQNN